MWQLNDMCMFCFHCGISNLHTLVLFLSCMINCLRSLLRKCMRNWESYFRLLFSLLLPLAWVLQAFFVHDDKWLQWRIVTTIVIRRIMLLLLRLASVWNCWKDQRMYIKGEQILMHLSILYFVWSNFTFVNSKCISNMLQRRGLNLNWLVRESVS